MRVGLFFIIQIFTSLAACAQVDERRLKITHLEGDFFIYTTYNSWNGTLIPAHGMYVVTDSGVVVFDTPWDSTQFQPLLDTIRERHRKEVVICIATHWHSDRTEGLEYFTGKGIKTFTTQLTDDLSKKNGKKRAAYLMMQDTVFNVGQYAFEIYYPGEGHTADNIIAWFKRERILYGGCLIKGVEAKDLGNLSDANVKAYAQTLKRVSKKCPRPRHIIVSHHNWNSNRSLRHSISLAKNL